MKGTELPHIISPPPGPVSQAWIDRLSVTECPAITARRARRQEATGVSQDPIVWAEAKGANVKDVDGNVFVDLTSAFGVASLGHAPASVIDAVQEQTKHVMHAMGDVFPSTAKIEFSESLAAFCPEGLQHSILGLNGSDAVAAALKTAVMATGSPGIIAFEDSYHGLFYGSLSVSGYKKEFREPFRDQLNPNVYRFPFPDSKAEVETIVKQIKNTIVKESIGAIIVEPILGRGGERPAPPEFLHALRRIADNTDTVLIFDEIWTGLYRTGDRFACDHEGVVPDVLCLGKSLGGGLPLSAAIGTAPVMSSWGHSTGEAIHTATFLGHPLSCAAGSAVLRVLSDPEIAASIAKRAARFGDLLADAVDRTGCMVRGRGWLLGVVFVEPEKCIEAWRKMMMLGYLTLPSGPHGEVLAFTPPFVTTEKQLTAAMTTFKSVLANMDV